MNDRGAAARPASTFQHGGMKRRKPLKQLIGLIADVLLAPLVLVAAMILRQVRKSGLHKRPLIRRIFETIGVFPLRNHYYEPLYCTRRLDPAFREQRVLPGIDLNIARQLELIGQFHYNDELLAFPRERRAELEYFYINGAFGPGDGEYLYNIIRHFHPRQLIEVGSGHSTLMARNAIARNSADDPGYRCRHVCIEPYEQPWLEKLGIDIVRTPVEKLDPALFDGLQAQDILFIDSSHMIRPQGDVLFEYLELLPRLRPGVLVHVHDIFTPRDYPNEWVIDKIRFWNEQYLLEAFLTHNSRFEVIGALNHLAHHYPREFARCCPVQAESPGRYEPGSFWLRKLS